MKEESSARSRPSEGGAGVQSPFQRLAAVEVYDGSVAGIAIRGSGREFFVFELVAWDETQRRRVFLVSLLPEAVGRDAIDSFTRLGVPQWPEWWLNPSGTASVSDAIDAVFARSRAVARRHSCILATHSLLEGPLLIASATGEAAEHEVRRLLGDEASVEYPRGAPFDAWRLFVEQAATDGIF